MLDAEFTAKRSDAGHEMKVTSNTHLYLPFPRYGVLKHEVCVFCDILTDIITLGREQEVLVGIVGQRWGRCGGDRLVAGIPAPVAASGTAVASRQHFFPGPAGWLWDCLKNNTRINTIYRLHIHSPDVWG